MGGEVILSALTVHASEEKQYSNVLDDLKKDSTFDVATYPDDTEDVSVKVIQIAESEDGQLFLYVYQPADSKIDLQCTSVSISVGFSSNGQGLDPKLYDLILVSSEGVFDKYLVNGFSLPDEVYRYYNIVSLYREFNSAVDEVTDVETSEKAYSVGQQWCAYYLNDELVYEMNTFETLEIEYTFFSKIECSNGITIGNLVGVSEYCDVHYLAFTCDEYIIKYIYDADLQINTRLYKEWIHNTLESQNHITYPNGEEYVSSQVVLKDTDIIDIVGEGLWGRNYTCNRIMKSVDFIENLENQSYNFTAEAKASILESEWVFSYLETSRTGTSEGVWYTYEKTEVQASVLSLHFMDLTGKIYNLGVVSDMGVSTGNSGNFEDSMDKIMDLFYKILALVGIIVIIILLFTAFPVIKVVFSGFVFIIKMIWDLFTLPFRWIFKK